MFITSVVVKDIVLERKCFLTFELRFISVVSY